MELPLYLSPKEYAARLVVSPRTVQRMLADEEIPGAFRVRGAWRIPREATPVQRPHGNALRAQLRRAEAARAA